MVHKTEVEEDNITKRQCCGMWGKRSKKQKGSSSNVKSTYSPKNKAENLRMQKLGFVLSRKDELLKNLLLGLLEKQDKVTV